MGKNKSPLPDMPPVTVAVTETTATLPPPVSPSVTKAAEIRATLEPAPTIPATLEDFGSPPPPQTKGIYDLVIDFYEALANHKDAKVLASDFNGRPGQHVMFTDATRESQRVVELRFLMRWPFKDRS